MKKTILIIANFDKTDDQYTILAIVYGRELAARGYNVSYRCTNGSLSEGSMACDVCLNFTNNLAIDTLLYNAHPNMFTMKVSPNYTYGLQLTHRNRTVFIPENIVDTTIGKNATPLKIKELDGTYVFYTINRCYDYSNTAYMINTFFDTFHLGELVSLVICTDRKVDNEILNIKRMNSKFSNIDHYNKPIVIHGSLTDEQRFGIHNASDAFIKTDLDTNYLSNELITLSKYCCPMREYALINAFENKITHDVSAESMKVYSVEHHLKLLKGII